MVYDRQDVVGVDAAIVMNPAVWVSSGHVSGFTDPLVECKTCHKRFRADKPDQLDQHAAEHDGKVEWTEPKKFNLLTEVLLGVTEPKETAYLRGEITQGVFVNFRNVVDSSRVKIPFGIAQIGKAFRNEITPGNFTFRSREFEQMELEYFIKPDVQEGEKWFVYWQEERKKWHSDLGIDAKNLRTRTHEDTERAHYARKAIDIEYNAPFGWSELEGIHHRGDWDLSRHKLTYTDPETNETFTPWVIETSGGVDRATLFFLIDAYKEENKRIILKLHPTISPIKMAVFPLVANKLEIVEKAKAVYAMLKKRFVTAWDDRGNIGQRYYSQDEIGTPWCVTIDYDTLEDDTATVRDRDTTEQERVNVSKLVNYFDEKLS